MLRTSIGAAAVSPGCSGKYARGPMLTPGRGTVVVSFSTLKRLRSLLDVNVTFESSVSPGLTFAGTVTLITTSADAPVAREPVSGIPSLSVSGSGVTPSDS